MVLLDVCLMSYWMLSGMSYFGAASLIIKACTLLGLSSIMWQLTFLFDDKAQMDCSADKTLNTSQTFFAKLDVIMKDKGTVSLNLQCLMTM